jgi:hypothetical protein
MKKRRKTMSKIITSFLNPPIPVRCMDWQATYEGYEGGDAIGNGATEQEAIDNLIEQTEDTK